MPGSQVYYTMPAWKVVLLVLTLLAYVLALFTALLLLLRTRDERRFPEKYNKYNK
jgi:hypothetical protein